MLETPEGLDLESSAGLGSNAQGGRLWYELATKTYFFHFEGWVVGSCLSARLWPALAPGPFILQPCMLHHTRHGHPCAHAHAPAHKACTSACTRTQKLPYPTHPHPHPCTQTPISHAHTHTPSHIDSHIPCIHTHPPTHPPTHTHTHTHTHILPLPAAWRSRARSPPLCATLGPCHMRPCSRATSLRSALQHSMCV